MVMEFPVGESLTASAASSNGSSTPSLWSQMRPMGRRPPSPSGAVVVNGENGFLTAGFPPPVVHAFSIRTRLGTRLRVYREQLTDCWTRRRPLLAERPLRVYGTQAEAYASATAPSREPPPLQEEEEAAAAVGGGGLMSSSSSDSPPYLPSASATPSQQHAAVVYQPQQHRRGSSEPRRRDYRDLAV
jgi:hypothetical protein